MTNGAARDTDLRARSEIASATQVMLAMVKTVKGLKIYLPNNPVLIGFVEELDARMRDHLAAYGRLSLDVEPFALRYHGVDVYQNEDPKESLACRIYADGIRSLVFEKGVESKELEAFLGILGFDRPTSDDDVVTQLWERNLTHISYLLEEDFIEGQLEFEPAEPLPQQDAILRILREAAEAPPPQPKEIPTQLLVLSDDEERWLRMARLAEARHSALDDVVGILTATLAGVKDREIFNDFAGIMANLMSNMFLAGEVGHALRLARFIDRQAKLEETPPEQRQLLRRVLDDLLDEATLQVLQETLDGSETVTHEELKELLRILGIRSLAGICELLGRVEKLKVRKVIVEVLVELGHHDPAVFAPFLNDSRWYLVRNMVLVLSLLGTPVALKMIIGLISHKEPRIRREVLGFLERTGDPKAKTYLVKYLRDESSALRVKALQVLAREKLAFALKPVLALASADDFPGREPSEKKAVYEALGELGGDEVIPMLRDMLMKKYWFQKSMERESALLAVAALTKIATPAALQLLKEAHSQKKTAELRGVLEQAIAAIGPAAGEKP